MSTCQQYDANDRGDTIRHRHNPVVSSSRHGSSPFQSSPQSGAPNNTLVSERLRGRGFGKKLVATVVEKVRTALANLPLLQVEHQQPASYTPLYAFVKPGASEGLGTVL